MINVNGKVINSSTATFTTDNRAFNYGDGVFETIRIFDGEIPFLKLHYERFIKGCELLGLSCHQYSLSFFEREIRKLQLSPNDNRRIKFMTYRTHGGLYTPQSDESLYIVFSSSLEDSKFRWNTEGLLIDICKNVTLGTTILSNIKTCNALPYILAARYKKAQNWDDGIILNHRGNIAECTSSNIFIIKDKALYTPSLDEGCLDGTTRKLILLLTQQIGIPIHETAITLKDLNDAEEVFLTNAIQGIRWVRQFNNRFYKNEITKVLFLKLNQLL